MLDKKLKDVNNHDLWLCGLPDSVGSFLNNYIEENINKNVDEVKNKMTLGEFVKLYKKNY